MSLPLLSTRKRPLIRMGIHREIRQLLAGAASLVQWLSPPCCLLCEATHDRQQPICLRCELALPRNRLACHQCGLPLAAEARRTSQQISRSDRCVNCLRSPPRFQQTLAPFLMQEEMRKLIHLWKFHGQSQLTPLLAALFARAAPPDYPKSTEEPAVLVPVPTQWYRQVRRGFDHTWLLATALQWQLCRNPDVKHWLRNTRYQRPQHQLDRRTRIQGGADRFVAHPGVADRHIILIDDVMTTGSTAHSAAGACNEQGARSVAIWCLARTPAPENKVRDALR